MFGNGGGRSTKRASSPSTAGEHRDVRVPGRSLGDGLTQPNPATMDPPTPSTFRRGRGRNDRGSVPDAWDHRQDHPELRFAMAPSPDNKGAGPAALGVADPSWCSTPRATRRPIRSSWTSATPTDNSPSPSSNKGLAALHAVGAGQPQAATGARHLRQPAAADGAVPRSTSLPPPCFPRGSRRTRP